MICPLFRAAVIKYYGNVPRTHAREEDPDEMYARRCEQCINEKCAWWNKDIKGCSLRTTTHTGVKR